MNGKIPKTPEAGSSPENSSDFLVITKKLPMRLSDLLFDQLEKSKNDGKKGNKA
ncbi:P6 [Nephotettix cincticeps negative-stranded RNA virus 1]|nr:P6 [Nephotettix cincticeps negative-stranded RNA virus 1]